ncbi:hypothetical protein K435DRAFT_809901 [Dendrothele bispora CBS 962.96]|uniref:Uncharacterized protein n=1 Tax=Dendrothele bispora (strain CBS 962.96) TaxID=1314807 RepID=A0A4S8KWP1_DENBC|nr:hypothetical protein K435DRAFT_809901 [Dendrothele bispora CBS 962.96]
MSTNPDLFAGLTGLQNIVNQCKIPANLDADAIEDDFDGECEAFEVFKSTLSKSARKKFKNGNDGDIIMAEGDEGDDSCIEEDNDTIQGTSVESGIGSTANLDSATRGVLKDASKGITEGTEAEYKRLMRQMDTFLVEKNFLPPGQFFTMNPLHPDSAEFIVAFIMHSCDSILLNGSKKSNDQTRNGFGHAQKIRAAMTYGFNRHGHGLGRWEQSEVTQQMKGNPSISHLVSSYMISLRRRKATIKKLYDNSHTDENWPIKPYEPNSRNGKKKWGGPKMRRLLHLAYTAAFLCLLRFDEVLEIQAEDITDLILTCFFR